MGFACEEVLLLFLRCGEGEDENNYVTRRPTNARSRTLICPGTFSLSPNSVIERLALDGIVE
jgi:hypothetical protein